MHDQPLRFDGRRVPTVPGDSVLTALLRGGVHPTGGGCLCLAGDCPHCIAVVDGVAYTRTCRTPVVPGTTVHRQDRTAPELPAHPTTTSGPTRTVHTDVVVIGAGRSGLAEADRMRSAGRDVVVVEARDGDTAVGIYPGPVVITQGTAGLRRIHADEVVVATGSRETQPVCPGNDLDGLVTPRAAEALAAAGIDLGRIVAVGVAPDVPGCQAVDGTLVRLEGPAGHVAAVVVRGHDGAEVRHPCDTASLGLGAQPRDLLARMGHGLGVRAVGSAAAEPTAQPPPVEGTVCPCAGVTVADLDGVRRRGFDEMELAKRATLAGTGTCQGAACLPHLQAWLVAGAAGPARSQPFTARPVAHQLTMGQAAAGYQLPPVRRTTLHDVHVAAGATMDRFGGWWRPWRYGPDVSVEYWAVRRAVSLGDVSTLGKIEVAGPDAGALLDRLYPVPISTLQSGRSRYVLLLDEGGYLLDDGMACRRDDTRYLLSFTSAGVSHVEMWIRDWAQTWGMDVRIMDRTTSLGAINVTGPLAGELLRRAGLDAPPGFMRHGAHDVAGVPCDVFRLSFTGEVSYELHHAADRSVELWQQLMALGADLGVTPHGMDALFALRLEQGHVIVGMDTEMDSSPRRLGMDWAVRSDDGRDFVGRDALLCPTADTDDKRLIGLAGDPADAPAAPLEGDVLWHRDGQVGYVTSSRFSPTLDHAVALGWVRLQDGSVPQPLVTGGGLSLRPTAIPFYDPEGARARL
ncbi:2Fe-2S iron-sulfur cluster-binding protein [soil metagenome]